MIEPSFLVYSEISSVSQSI